MQFLIDNLLSLFEIFILVGSPAILMILLDKSEEAKAKKIF